MMTGFEQYTRKTRRTIFLEEMEQVVPWRELCALVAPHYPKPGNGRRPVGVERMLRIYFLQQWFNLSDPAVEEALYDSAGMRQFVGIDLGCEPVPDETTVCKFRHLLEERSPAFRGASRACEAYRKEIRACLREVNLLSSAPTKERAIGAESGVVGSDAAIGGG